MPEDGDDIHDMYRRGSITPIPDPTRLTQEATQRLEMTMRNLIETENQHVLELIVEKFRGVESRFSTLEARTAEQKQDTTNALNAALAAQKEAVAAQTASSEKSITKSETATTERIKGVETLLSTSAKATDDKISDLKERLVAIEAGKVGSTEERIEQRNHATGETQKIGVYLAAGLSALAILVSIISVIAIIAANHL